jgi:hypothetical protein
LESEQAPQTVVGSEEDILPDTETHRTVLNQILRQSTTYLKRRYFRTELERLDGGFRLVKTNQIVFIENLRFLKHLLRDLLIAYCLFQTRGPGCSRSQRCCHWGVIYRVVQDEC